MSSCINIKSDYPQIQYYRLIQEPTKLKNLATIEGSLQVRAITISDEFKYDNLLAFWDSSYIQMYYYHRWIADPGSLVTDFIINRYNSSNAFSYGVINSSAITVPDYIMEGQVLDWTAYSSNKEASGQFSNYINFSIRINVIRRDSLGVIRSKLLNKVYSIRIPRPNNNVQSIPPAFSSAVSHIADLMLLDIQVAIATDQKVKE
jgi:ABC-type uncharacterized transport system auxiliary subunit